MSDLGWFLIAGLPLIALWIVMLAEVVSRSDLSVGRRVVWVGAFLVASLLALAAYLVVRPGRRTVPDVGPSELGNAEAIVVASERRQLGEIDSAQYRATIAELTSS